MLLCKQWKQCKQVPPQYLMLFSDLKIFQKNSAHEKIPRLPIVTVTTNFNSGYFLPFTSFTLMTMSNAMKTMASCLGLRQTCFRNLTFYDPCWKYNQSSWPGSLQNKTIEDGSITVDFLIIKVHPSNWSSLRIICFFAVFFSLSMYKISENLLWVRTSCGHLENIWEYLEGIYEHLETSW